jgi:UDPglucose--hexose-1-phosphate uridylyltransferase
VQELLRDELTGDQVILAPGRALRPDTFRTPAVALPPTVATCPFCDGNERETPPEVARRGAGAPDTRGWSVRVVPNKYPIVGEGVPGAHEVVVLSPAHDADLGGVPPEQCVEMFLALRDRARYHLAHGRVQAVPFVNHGKGAGASIEHPHAQLVALDFVPPRVATRLAHFSADALERDQEYVVVKNDATVWCPPASTSPLLMRACVPGAGSRFDEADDDAVTAIANAVNDAVARLHAVLGNASYNCVFNTAPRDHAEPFQWTVDIIPRVSTLGGFELGTGVWVNVVHPRDAAAALRDAR